MAVKAVGTRNGFTTFKGAGTGPLFTVLRDAGPELQALAEAYPEFLSDALRHLANRIRLEIKQAIVKGGPEGHKWQERSRMHIYRRMDLSTQGRYTALRLVQRRGYKRYAGMGRASYAGAFNMLRGDDERRDMRHYSRGGRLYDREQPLPDAFTRWIAPGGSKKLRNRGAMQGNLEKAIRYKRISSTRVDVGAVSPSAAHYLDLAQRGRRQAITPKMRIKFWAAGVPIANAKNVIVQDPRPLIEPIHRKFAPYMEAILIDRINSYIRGERGENASVLYIPDFINEGSVLSFQQK